VNQVSTEKYLEKLDVDVYPITVIKLLLNKRRIQSYFSRAASDTFEIRGEPIKIDHSQCSLCREKESMGVLCRQHTSIDRILTGDRVLFDLDTNVYMTKNEIFRMVGKRLVVIYCPHPKLISGVITDKKVRKINTMTIEDPDLDGLPPYTNVKQFLSSTLMDQNMKCWFNNEFSIVTIPKDRTQAEWCLVANSIN